MFTPFQRAFLAVVVAGFVAVGAVAWATGESVRRSAATDTPKSAPAQAPVLSQTAPPPGIVAVGEASVEAAPDTGYLAFAVQVGGPVGSDIAGQLQTRVDRLLEKARALGIHDDEIIHGPLQFQPQYQYDPAKGGPQVISFNAYQQIAIECDEVEMMPALVQELMKDPATSALSVRYSPNREGAAYKAAREKAIADARAQAQLTAAAVGLKLGPAISVIDYRAQSQQPYPVGVVQGKFPTVGGPGFPPAEIDTVIRVQVQFAVEPLD